METVPFLTTVQKKYRSYAAHILGFRHFAEGRDGLKPVQRRGLWAMRQLNAVDEAHVAGAPEITGLALGSFHPHESGAIFNAIANISQASVTYPLVMGVGNWGSHDSGPSAMRYVKAYLSPYALSMMDKDELTCVPMDETYNGKNKEPRFLPARLPHLLVGGCESLASGYAGNIPPSNPAWVLDALGSMINGQKIKLPKSFANRWGGELLSLDKSWLRTGIAAAEYRPEFHVEGNSIVFTSLAPGMKLLSIETRLEKLTEFAGLAQESVAEDDDKSKVRVVVRFKRGSDVARLATALLETMKIREHYSFLSISQREEDGEITYDPITEGPTTFLESWVAWRQTIIKGAANYRIKVFQHEMAYIDLMLRAINKRKQLLAILDQAKNREDLRVRTSKLLKCSLEEASLIMGVAWSKLAFMETQSFLDRHAECAAGVTLNSTIVRNPDKRLMPDAETAIEALKKTQLEVDAMRKDGKPVRRRKNHK